MTIFTPSKLRALSSVFAVAALSLFPKMAFAEFTKMYFHDARSALVDVNHAFALTFDGGASTNNQSVVASAKALLDNPTGSPLRVECLLMNFGVTSDTVDVTIPPFSFSGVSLMIASASRPGNDVRFYCYGVGTQGAFVQGAKMTVRYGAPSVSVVSQ